MGKNIFNSGTCLSRFFDARNVVIFVVGILVGVTITMYILRSQSNIKEKALGLKN